MKLTVLSLILISLLGACATVPTSIVPILPDPPNVVVDALESAANDDPNAAAWVIELDRFYQKQDILNDTL